jgi:hypothetical protein
MHIILCFLLAGQSCHKSTTQQQAAPVTPNSTVFTGVASYSSYYYYPEDTSLKMSSQLVFIAEDTGTFNQNIYIDSTKTDNSGNFTFYDLDPSIRYVIFAKPSIASSSTFTAPYLGMVNTDSPYNAGASYNFIAALNVNKTNGINFTTQDIDGGRMGGTTVIVYNSQIVAMRDTIFSGKGSVVILTTDSLGKALATGLPARTLYVNALLMIDSVNYFRTLANPVTVGAKGFQLMTLTLQ